MINATPLLPLDENLWAKAEYENPTGSIKDRAARLMLEKAALSPGSTVIEPTSGNFGIALTSLCREKELDCILVMPDSMSRERQEMLRALGARVVLTPGSLGMTGSIDAANALAMEIPGSFVAGQFENPNNPLAHYLTTGPEIWAQTEGKVDVFVAGVGTGGTLAGVARYLRERKPEVWIVAVEPASSPLLSQGWAGSHNIQGIGANFVPPLLNDVHIDQVVTVSDEDAFAAAKWLNDQGIPAGISAGANVHAAAQFAAQGYHTVTLLPDHKNRYTSLGL